MAFGRQGVRKSSEGNLEERSVVNKFKFQNFKRPSWGDLPPSGRRATASRSERPAVFVLLTAIRAFLERDGRMPWRALRAITLIRRGNDWGNDEEDVARVHVPPETLESWRGGEEEAIVNIHLANGEETTASASTAVRCRFFEPMLTPDHSPFDDAVGSAVVRTWALVEARDAEGQIEPSFTYRTMKWSDARPWVETVNDFVRLGGLVPYRKGAAEPPTFRFPNEATARECLKRRQDHYASEPFFPAGTPSARTRTIERIH